MRKLISLLLAAIMVVSLAACASQPAATETPATEAATTAAAASQEETTKAAATEASTEAATEAAEKAGVLPLVPAGEKKVITIGTPADPKTEDYDTNDYTLWLEEQTGVDIEFVLFSSDSSEMRTQINAMVAANEKLPDILSMCGIGSAMRDELGEGGYLVDLSEYFEKYGHFWKEGYEAISDKELADKAFVFGRDANNGALYTYPDFNENYNVDHLEYAVSINQEWLDKVGKKAPATVDELYDVLAAFRDYGDINGDGIENDIPMFGNYTGSRADITEWIISAYVLCNDTYRFNVTDGKVWSPYITDEYREALKYMNRLYVEGLISPLMFSGLQNADVKPMITPEEGSSVIGVFGGYPTVFMVPTCEEIKKFTALAPLAAETELGGYSALKGPSYAFNTFITTDAEDPGLCFRLLDFMNSYDSTTFERFGVEGRDWNQAPEGSTTVFGSKGSAVIINDVFTTQNNAVWHQMRPAIKPDWYISTAFVDDGSPLAARQKLESDIFKNFKLEAKTPAETLTTVLYNSEENETVSEVQSTVNGYIDEARALFISGALDPNNDADWKTYLDNLETQGLSKLTEVTQTAYTRMNQ